jgi:hypothetical protein
LTVITVTHTAFQSFPQGRVPAGSTLPATDPDHVAEPGGGVEENHARGQ